jgi:raffinose/stachyose/melibiose transport system permease protein
LNWLGTGDLAVMSVMVLLIWAQIGYPVVVFMAALERVDPELYEAAEVDGAGAYQRFRAITLPQIKPETFVVTLTCTVAALKVFGPVYALTEGGPAGATYVPSYYSFTTFFQKFQVGYGSAIASVLALVILIISLIILWVQRRSERKEEAGL